MNGDRPLKETVEAADNPEPRCPCVLLLDTSGSMRGERLAALNEGLRTLRDELIRDNITARRVEVAIITFDSQVRIVQRFVTADRFDPPVLTASGQTRMAAGIEEALTMVETRKEQYKRHGLYYYRPWILMITDGKPEGDSQAEIAEATRHLREDEKAKRVAFFAVGVEDADLEGLQEIVVRPPMPLDGLKFGELFSWLSQSMQAVSQSQPGDRVELPQMGWLRKLAALAKKNQEPIRDVIAIGRIVLKVVAGV